MEDLPPEQRHAFQSDLLTAIEAGRSRVVPATQTGRQNTWTIWEAFCLQHGQDPYLQSYEGEALDFFIVFGMRYRRGEISKSGKSVLTGAVAEALRAVGQRFTELDIPDPRLLSSGKLQPRLKSLLDSFENADPAPSRVWPVNITILQALKTILDSWQDQAQATAILDLSIIAFFFLCRPGEYALTSKSEPGRSSPFRLENVRFTHATKHGFSAVTSSLNDVQAATYVALTYTDQKNATRDESIGHASTTHAFLDPVQATRRRVLHLRAHFAEPAAPLHRYYDSRNKPFDITTTQIGQLLRQAAKSVQHITGIPPDRIQAYSLRSGGATALLCAKVDQTVIQLIGRWKSDAMFRYLRTQAMPVTNHTAHLMLSSGTYTFAPTAANEPDPPDLLPEQTPPAILQALGDPPAAAGR